MILQPVGGVLGTGDRRYLLLGLTLVSLLLSLLVACNPVALSPSRQSAAPSGQILLWHSYEPATEFAKLLRADIDQYQQLYPAIRVVSEYIPGPELSQHFIAQVQSGLGPDLLLNFANTIPSLVAAEVLQPIHPDSIDLAPYIPEVLERIHYRGQLYGIPWSLQTQVLCYNQRQLQPGPPPHPISSSSPTAPVEALSESGSLAGAMPAATATDLALLQPATTLAGLLERARAGYTVGLVSSLVQTWWGATLFGGQFLDAQGRVVPQLDGWARWLEWLKQASALPNVVFNSNRALLHEAFAQGRLTYYVCDSTEIPQFKARLGESLGVALLPGERDRPAQPPISAQVLFFNQTSGPPQTRLALDLAKFLTNQEHQGRRVLAAQAFIPANRRVELDLQLFPIESVLIKQVRTSRLVIPIEIIEPLQQILLQGESLYEKVMAGTMQPAQAAAELSQMLHQRFDKNAEG
jgi:ABC-type glycerol-3-phosphate transport system substrate-binding protein